MTAPHLHRPRPADPIAQALREAKKRAKERQAAQQKDAPRPDESFAAMGEADRLEMLERGCGS